MTVSQILPMIRTLLDDDVMDFTTFEYLAPKIQLALNKLVLDCLNNPNMGTLKTVVILPTVPAGTTTLATYFESGGPLALLSDIISLKERPSAGSRTEAEWTDMDQVPNLPAFIPASYNRVFVWTLDDVKLLGATADTDLRVFGKFTPVVISSEETAIPPSTDTILSYRAASIAAKARGNAQLGVDYADEAKGLTDSLFANVIMNQQSMRVRMRPFSTPGYRF